MPIVAELKIALTLALSLLAGLAVLLTYSLQNRDRAPEAPLRHVIPVLSVLMSVMMQTSNKIEVFTFFGIFGILSIVRFRSVLTDQRGITFILFSAIMGVLIGIEAWYVALIAFFMITIALQIVNRFTRSSEAAYIVVRLPSGKPETQDTVLAFLTRRGIHRHTTSIKANYQTNKNGVLVDTVSLRVIMEAPSNEAQFCAELIEFLKENNLEGEYSSGNPEP